MGGSRLLSSLIFSSSGEVISSRFETAPSKRLHRPNLDGGKQHHTFGRGSFAINTAGVQTTCLFAKYGYKPLRISQCSEEEPCNRQHTPHSLYYPKECPRGSATDWYSLWVSNSESTIIALARHAFLFPGAIPDDCRAQWHTPDNTYINELSPTWIMTPPRAPHHCPGLYVKEGTGSQARARPSEWG